MMRRQAKPKQPNKVNRINNDHSNDDVVNTREVTSQSCGRQLRAYRHHITLKGKGRKPQKSQHQHLFKVWK